MIKRIFFLTAIILIFQNLFFSCSSSRRQAGHHDDVNLQSERLISNKTVEMRNNSFAFDIFNELSDTSEENLVISPFSISTALAMTYAGAAGETAEQMSNTLFFERNQDVFHEEFSSWMNQIITRGAEKDQLRLANSLWPQEDYPFHEDFMKLIEKYYHSAFYKVNYKGDREAIRQQINLWVEKHTNNLIKDLIQPGILVEDTRLVLVNAIYFLSNWKIAFDQNATHNARFNVSSEKQVNVPFMFMRDTLNYFETEYFQAIELEYEGSGFSMMVMLPSIGQDLNRMINKMDAAGFSEIAEKMEKQNVEVYLPSFKVRSKFDLERMLAAMGMPYAFSNLADFSRMTPLDDLKIDKVIHEAFVDVHEEGTEAAASTAVVIIRKSAVIDDQKKVFRADRPFFFAIKENHTNSILFMGKIVNPELRAE